MCSPTSLRPGREKDRDEVIHKLIDIQYSRNDMDFKRGSFRVRGDVLEVYPAYSGGDAYRIEFFGDEVDRITEIDTLTGEIKAQLGHIAIFPASHYVIPKERMEIAANNILEEMKEQVAYFKSEDKLLEAQRIAERTNFDVEMMRETGFCSGIENYSRHLIGSKPGEPPCTLMDYFPENYLVMIDESHMTIPQIRAMYHGDLSRKTNLVNYGFRLRSAYDNRPLTFEEFNAKLPQLICVSATPADYELDRAGQVVEQLIRPTGLLDPTVEVRPTKGQIDDVLVEIHKETAKNGRVLITTLTKKMAESLTEYLSENGVRVRYMHSDIDTLERIDIITGLRNGEFDVLVGINLLREGLDLPEVRLVVILDADKEGFLRSETAFIQTTGRAARNAEGRVIMYADVMTGSMKRAIDETERRRKIQSEYNAAHGIVPKTIIKKVINTIEITRKADRTKDIKMSDIPAEIEKLKGLMKVASAQLDFEQCIEIRETIAKLKAKMRKAQG